MKNKLFLNWTDAYAVGASKAGGKGWNLGRLDRYGFPIPAGGVLTAEAYRKFVEFNDLESGLAEFTHTVTIDTIGDKETGKKLALIREKIHKRCVPEEFRLELEVGLKTLGILDKPVAVRSSATAEDSAAASFAGIHDSFLNVNGIDNILSAIKGCYASLWTERAVYYRRKMCIADNAVLPAIVIMEMVHAEASGIAFSCDPRTGREDIVTINANFGLGESVVSPPDYIIWETPQFAKQISRLKGNSLDGLGVAAGKATGTARLVSHPNEGEKLQPGDVMIAPSTDPGWTPLFLKVSAIVMETGGFLAHGAIVAREYGVPAVVNIPGVMKIIKDSQQITVDGDEGKVYF